MPKWKPYTIVLWGTMTPVVPVDCNPEDESDEGMLVYRSQGAAKSAARHQLRLHECKCRAVTLGSVIEHEANVSGSIGKKTPKGVPAKLRGRKKIHDAIGAST